MKIYKYELMLTPSGIATAMMPVNARILKVGAQKDTIVVWAVVKPEDPAAVRKFRIVPTGGDLESAAFYYGTVVINTPNTFGAFPNGIVLHVFDED